jgi:hypothetical protein
MSVPDFPVDERFLDELAMAAMEMVAREPNRGTTIGSGSLALAQRMIARRSPGGSIYIHRWLRSDPDDLHDHPWDFCSVILTVGYWEITPDGSFYRPPGSVVIRKAEERHRVQIDPDKPNPISLFITGAERRAWGFHTEEGWIERKKHRSVGEYRRRRDYAVTP